MTPHPLKKIAFILEEFTAGSTSQHLVDRLLVGYNRDGTFHKLQDCKAGAFVANNVTNPLLDIRSKNFGLEVKEQLAAVTTHADGILIVPKSGAISPSGELVKEVLLNCGAHSRCFVHGALAKDGGTARELVGLAKKQQVNLLSFDSTPGLSRLPANSLREGTEVNKALIIVQGTFGEGEVRGLNGLFGILEPRTKRESGVSKLRYISGTEVWEAGKRGEWSEKLLGSAISRSNTTLADSLVDGRTQDIFGLNLVPGLVKNPRAWLLEHSDGLRSAILVLDGATRDINFALELKSGALLSAQLYRPPTADREEFSQEVAAIEDYFRTGTSFWPGERSALISDLLGQMREQSGSSHWPG
jgi:hypothetical protein